MKNRKHELFSEQDCLKMLDLQTKYSLSHSLLAERFGTSKGGVECCLKRAKKLLEDIKIKDLQQNECKVEGAILLDEFKNEI